MIEKENISHIDCIEGLFFELLQVACGNRERLSGVPSAEEWEELRQMAKKQTLNGIAYAGMERLPQEQWPDRYFRLRWGGKVQKIIDRNKVLNERCDEVAHRFRYDGFWCCILKGQGNLYYYPEWLKDKRTPGDIDVWVRKNTSHPVRDVIEFCTSKRPGTYIYYHHLDFPALAGVDIEVHYRPTWLFNPWRDRKLQKWFKDKLSLGMVEKEFNKFPIPNAKFNALFLLLHIYKHLFEEGIGLRQLLDYYFVLKNIDEVSKDEIRVILKKINCHKFAGALMWVLNEVFSTTEIDKSWILCEMDAEEGKFLLKEIMKSGNFGKYDERITHYDNNAGFVPKIMYAYEKLKHNWRFIAHYPEEVIFEPPFRLFHWIWRALKLWKFE